MIAVWRVRVSQPIPYVLLIFSRVSNIELRSLSRYFSFMFAAFRTQYVVYASIIRYRRENPTRDTSLWPCFFLQHGADVALIIPNSLEPSLTLTYCRTSAMSNLTELTELDSLGVAFFFLSAQRCTALQEPARRIVETAGHFGCGIFLANPTIELQIQFA